MCWSSYLSGREDVLDGLSDLRTNTVTLDQSNGVLALISRKVLISIVVKIGRYVYQLCDRCAYRGWRRHGEKNGFGRNNHVHQNPSDP